MTAGQPGAQAARMMLTVGVTGHVDLVPGELEALGDRVRAFFIHLAETYPDLDLQLLSPLAQGADALVTEVALELDIPVVAVLPLTLDQYREDFSDSDARAIFERQLGLAERVIELPLKDGVTEDGVAHAGRHRDLQYAQAGIFLSNHSHVLLALWDGRVRGSLGGTGDVVRYHLTAVMPGYGDDSESPNLLADNENDLVYHIVCSRQAEPDGPGAGFTPLETGWVTAHFGREPGERMPAEYAGMLDRLQAFSRDAVRYADPIGEHGATLLAGELPGPAPAGAVEIDRHFRVADWLAIHFRRNFIRGLQAIHLVAILMGLAFIVYSEFDVSDLWVLAFLGLFFVGIAIYLVGESREWHRKYLDYRALAEGLRVQFYWTVSGVTRSQVAVFAYDNFLQKQDVDLGWIRHVMRAADLHRDRVIEPEEGWLAWSVDQWIGRPNQTAGQVAYFRNKAAHKASLYRRTELVGQVCLWSGIAIAVALVVASGRIGDDDRQWLMLFMGVLPLVAAVRSTYSHKLADKELIKQYRFMGDVFDNARRLLADANDKRMQRRVLRAVGDAALEEHAEWILMHRERPLEHSQL